MGVLVILVRDLNLNKPIPIHARTINKRTMLTCTDLVFEWPWPSSPWVDRTSRRCSTVWGGRHPPPGPASLSSHLILSGSYLPTKAFWGRARGGYIEIGLIIKIFFGWSEAPFQDWGFFRLQQIKIWKYDTIVDFFLFFFLHILDILNITWNVYKHFFHWI